MKRGHSNVHAKQTEPWDHCPENAKIPIEGGADVYTVRPLPPLALSKEEWQEIGRRMGWLILTKVPARGTGRRQRGIEVVTK